MTHTRAHTHTHNIYIYIYIICVCVYMYVLGRNVHKYISYKLKIKYFKKLYFE